MRSWGGKKSYPDVVVEVEGYINHPVFTVPEVSYPSKQSLLERSFIPCKCREHGSKNGWYNVSSLECFHLLDHPPQLQTPRYDRVRNILEERFADLTYIERGLPSDQGVGWNDLAEESAISSLTMLQDQMQSSDSDFIAIQLIMSVCDNILFGFMKNMDDISGRMALYGLLVWLSQDLSCKSGERYECTNCGGGSVKCEHRRLIKPHIKEEDAKALSPSSSIGTRSRKERSRSPASSTSSSPPSPWYPYACMPTVSTDADSAHILAFVPDIVLQTVKTTKGRQARDKWVIITGSVKGGMFLSEQARIQLQYEMLPVVIEQKVALGLLLCSSEAILIKMSVQENTISNRYLRYAFVQDDKKFKFESFNKMCRDIIYHCQMLYNTVSGAD